MHVLLLQVGDWIATRKDLEHINAAWLILPVGNFVAALVGPGLDQAYVPAMQFWFAFALMLWVLLFAITFAKAIIMTDNGGWFAGSCSWWWRHGVAVTRECTRPQCFGPFIYGSRLAHSLVGAYPPPGQKHEMQMPVRAWLGTITEPRALQHDVRCKPG